MCSISSTNHKHRGSWCSFSFLLYIYTVCIYVHVHTHTRLFFLSFSVLNQRSFVWNHIHTMLCIIEHIPAHWQCIDSVSLYAFVHLFYPTYRECDYLIPLLYSYLSRFRRRFITDLFVDNSLAGVRCKWLLGLHSGCGSARRGVRCRTVRRGRLFTVLDRVLL